MDEAVAAAQAAAKNAKKAAALTVIAVVVAIAVLAIDNGIKRAVLEKADEARRTLDEFGALVSKHTAVVEVDDGAEEAGEGGTPAGPDLNGSHGVVHDAPAGPADGEAPGAAKPAPAGRAPGAARRTRGNG